MEQEDYLKSETNRLNLIADQIISLQDEEEMMIALMEVLTETELIPDVGRYYTFIYSPKTPRIKYDQFPLIACIELFPWGFRGINYHLGGAFRNYTWNEINGFLHLIYPNELEDARRIPYQYLQINN